MIFHVEVTVEGENGVAAPPPVRPSRDASSSTAGSSVSYSGGVQQAGALAMAAAAGSAAEGYADDEVGPRHVEQRRVDETEQLGRNDPCWCGSGKKFKKCHGA
jgi:preprotein translocase subunit SecA